MQKHSKRIAIKKIKAGLSERHLNQLNISLIIRTDLLKRRETEGATEIKNCSEFLTESLVLLNCMSLIKGSNPTTSSQLFL